MQGNLLLLGTGASMGTPVVSCRCEVCRSKDPKDRRMRPAALVRVGGKQFLIDAGPDFRTQALGNGIEDLDGVLLTHSHFDHIAGLDDLRVFYFLHHKTVPCLLSYETLEDLQKRYYYFFKKSEDDVMGGSRFLFQPLPDDFGTASFGGYQWRYCTFFQNETKVTGYRLGNMAYLLDVQRYSDEVFAALEGVEVLILSALRQAPSRAHLSIEDAIAFAKRVGAKKTFFSHLAHEVGHEKMSRALPPGIFLGYDGLEVPFDVY